MAILDNKPEVYPSLDRTRRALEEQVQSSHIQYIPRPRAELPIMRVVNKNCYRETRATRGASYNTQRQLATARGSLKVRRCDHKPRISTVSIG